MSVNGNGAAWEWGGYAHISRSVMWEAVARPYGIDGVSSSVQ